MSRQRVQVSNKTLRLSHRRARQRTIRCWDASACVLSEFHNTDPVDLLCSGAPLAWAALFVLCCIRFRSVASLRRAASNVLSLARRGWPWNHVWGLSRLVMAGKSCGSIRKGLHCMLLCFSETGIQRFLGCISRYVRYRTGRSKAWLTRHA